MKESGTLINDVAAARLRILQLVHTLPARQAAFKLNQDCWCINEILEHLVLAELSGVSKVWAAAEGVKALHRMWSGEHTNAGLGIEEIVRRTWKEKEEAPPVATPLIGGPLHYWVETFKLCQPLLEALGRLNQDMDMTQIVYPHVLCDPLDAVQRIEFLRFHMDRHRRQIQRLMQLPDFPRN